MSAHPLLESSEEAQLRVPPLTAARLAAEGEAARFRSRQTAQLAALPLGRIHCVTRRFFFPVLEARMEGILLQQSRGKGAKAVRSAGTLVKLDWFEGLVAFAIVAYFITLNVTNSTPLSPDQNCSHGQNAFLVFLSVFFFAELGLRVVAMGPRYLFCFALFRAVDLLLIGAALAATVTMCSGSGTGVVSWLRAFSLLRILRIFKMLRRVKELPSIAIIVSAVKALAVGMADATLLLLLCLVVFAAAAMSPMSPFMGQRCVNNFALNSSNIALLHDNIHTIPLTADIAPSAAGALSGALPDLWDAATYVCGGWFDSVAFPAIVALPFAAGSEGRSVSGVNMLADILAKNVSVTELGCNSNQLCSISPGHGFQCPFGYSCLSDVQDPYNGYVKFNNMAWSFLNMFVSISMQIWYEIGYYGKATIGPVGEVFMSAFTLLVSYFVLNVIIIILCIEFDKARRKEEHRLALETAAGLRDTASISLFQAAKGTGRRFQRLVSLLVKQKVKEAEAEEARRTAEGTDSSADVSIVGEEDDGGDSMEGSSSAIVTRRHRPRARSEAQSAAIVTASLTMGKRVREMSTVVCQSLAFKVGVSLCIIANTVAICFVRHDMPDTTAGTIRVVSLCLTIAFVAETAVRAMSVGLRSFLTSPAKILDALVVVMCVIDLVAPQLHIGWLRVLRLPRVLGFILSAFPKVLFWFAFSRKAVMRAPFVAAMLWFLVICFGAIGVQLYGGTLCHTDDGDSMADSNNPACPGRPRNNFDSFAMAQITSFQILTADNWNSIVYLIMEANGNVHGVIFCIYYFFATVVGLSLFTASMLSVQDEAETDEVEAGSVEAKLIELAQKAKRHVTEDQPQQTSTEERVEQPALVIALGADEPSSPATAIARASATITNVVGSGVEVAKQSYSKLRQLIRTIVESFWYRLFSAAVVIIQSLSLALVDPLQPPDEYSTFALNVVNIVSTLFFMGETGLRIVAYGFIQGPDTFLRRSKWNVFDFVMLLLSILGIVFAFSPSSGSSRSAFAVRSALSLRPLLVVKLFPQVELVLFSMAKSIADLRYLIGTIGVFYLTAAVAGVHMFAGALYSCQATSTSSIPSSSNFTSFSQLDAEQCLVYGGQWTTNDPNFDNIFEAFFSVFFISIMENWSHFMFQLMDFNGVDKAPKVNANKWASIYCILVCIVTGFIIPNLVSTSLVRSYNKVKRSATHQKSAFETSERNAWIATNKRLVRMLPVEVRQRAIEGDTPTSVAGNVQEQLGRAVGAVMNLVGIDHQKNIAVKTWTAFVRGENFKLCCFYLSFASFICAAVQFYPETRTLAAFLRNSDIFFSACFCAEMAVKIWCEGLNAYLSSSWNRTDALITISSTVFVGVEAQLGISFARGIRCFRVLRINRVVQSASQLQVLITSIGFSITQIVPVLAICFIIYSAFSTAAIFLFGRLMYSPYDPNTICSSVNFGTFGSAFAMLFRLSTGGNWYNIVQVASNTSPTCTDEMQRMGLCGPPLWLARAFFSTWMIISYYVLNNVVIATLLDAFLCSANERALTKKDAHKIFAAWQIVDPQLTMSVAPFDLLTVLRRMPARSPMACMVGGGMSRCSQEIRFLTALGIEDPSLPNLRVSFRAFFDLLCCTSFDVSLPPRDRVLKYDFEQAHLALAMRLLEAKQGTPQTPSQGDDRLQQLLGSPLATAGASALKSMMKLTTSSASFLLEALLPEELINQASAAAEDMAGSPRVPEEVKEALVEATQMFRRSAALIVINEFVKKWRARSRQGDAAAASGPDRSTPETKTQKLSESRRFLPFSLMVGPLLERLSDDDMNDDGFSSDEEMRPVLTHPL